MDQSYFQKCSKFILERFYKSGMDNILDRTGQKFGISIYGNNGSKIALHIWKFMKETIHLPQF